MRSVEREVESSTRAGAATVVSVAPCAFRFTAKAATPKSMTADRAMGATRVRRTLARPAALRRGAFTNALSVSTWSTASGWTSEAWRGWYMRGISDAKTTEVLHKSS